MIRGFCRAHDENPTLFRFLLFVQHGQLGKLAPETLTPVDVDAQRARARRSRPERLPDQPPDLATAIVFGVVLRAGHSLRRTADCRRTMASLCDRLVIAARGPP